MMSRQTHTIAALLSLLAGVALGCSEAEAPEYVFGDNLNAVRFEVTSTDLGIHPSEAVLADPNNPFYDQFLGELKWEVHASAGNVPAFYGWATMLVFEPIGENQYYAATRLRDIYYSGEYPEGDGEVVRSMAIRAFQSVLDNFPDSVTFDATGTIPYRLAPLAYNEIIALGGTVQGNWVVVQLDDTGATTVVQGGADVPQGDSP